MRSNQRISTQAVARWMMSVIMGASLTLLAPVAEALEMIEVERVGSKRIMGTLLGVRAGAGQILAKVSLEDKHELYLPIEQLETTSREKVLTVMAQLARFNGAKMPALKFTATKKSQSNMNRGISKSNETVKSTLITHQLSVLNSGAVATGPILFCQLSRSVTTRRSDSAPSSKEISWDIDEEKIDALQPGQRMEAAFAWLEDRSQKSKTSQTSTAKVAGRIVNVVTSSWQSEQTNIEAVYLMAFDQTTGMLIYFVKM